jgi:large subunit ribosomal protein L24
MAQLQSKLKKGDEVIVISGKSKGQSGKITKVVTETNRVYVEGVNLVKKFLSGRKAMMLQREPGQIDVETSIAVSNVMLKDPKTGKPTRVGYRIEADGSKVRVAKGSNTVLDTISKGGAKDKPAGKASKPATKTKSK